MKEDYIALLDTDMLLRAPLDPLALGARPGVVVSAEYSYLVGTDTANATHDRCFARRFLEPAELGLMARCGGFHIFHREDIRRIAPLWIDFTRRVRAFSAASPDAYYPESFLDWHNSEGVSDEAWRVRRRQGLWQAEMYGYIFAAARVGVSHVVRRDTMLYPGYDPTGGMLPAILHYGADYTIEADESDASAAAPGEKEVYFNKMTHTKLDILSGGENGEGGVRCDAPFFFSQPPPPYRRDGHARSKRDMLCIEHLQLLNSALCELYHARCDGRIGKPCPRSAELSVAIKECRDEHRLCNEYARDGECEKNPKWMLAACAAACDACAPDKRRRHVDAIQPFDLIGPLAAPLSLALTHAYATDGGVDGSGLLSDGDGDADGFVSVERLSSPMRTVAEAAAYLGCSEGAKGTGKGWCVASLVRIRYASLATSVAAAVATAVPPASPTLPYARELLALPDSSIGLAAFGARLHCLRAHGRIHYAAHACTPPQEVTPHVYAGAIVLALRGGCTFVAKARHAQAGGASAILVYSDRPTEELASGGGGGNIDHPLAMADDGSGSDISIPAIGLTQSAGGALRKALAAHTDEPAAVVAVSLEGVEIAISTQLHASERGGGLRVATREPERVELCGRRSAEGADGGARVAVDASNGGSGECVPPLSTMALSEAAFDAAQWAALRDTGRCEAEEEERRS